MSLLNDLINTTSNIIGGVTSAISDSVNQAVNYGNTIIDSISSALNSGVSSVVSTVSDVVNTVSSTVTQSGQNISETIESVESTINDIQETVSQYITNSVSSGVASTTAQPEPQPAPTGIGGLPSSYTIFPSNKTDYPYQTYLWNGNSVLIDRNGQPERIGGQVVTRDSLGRIQPAPASLVSDVPGWFKPPTTTQTAFGSSGGFGGGGASASPTPPATPAGKPLGHPINGNSVYTTFTDWTGTQYIGLSGNKGFDIFREYQVSPENKEKWKTRKWEQCIGGSLTYRMVYDLCLQRDKGDKVPRGNCEDISPFLPITPVLVPIPQEGWETVGILATLPETLTETVGEAVETVGTTAGQVSQTASQGVSNLSQFTIPAEINEGLTSMFGLFKGIQENGLMQYLIPSVSAAEIQGLEPIVRTEDPKVLDVLIQMGVASHTREIDMGKLMFVGIVGLLLNAVKGPAGTALDYALNSLEPITIPTPPDLVRFQVREVFDPKYREELMYGLESPDYFSAMKKWGFNSDWAASYWAAHWELPSPMMGYEFLHRLRPGRVSTDLEFTGESLFDLLKRADYLPAYIPHMMAISYQTITRVDIRRMRKSGVIGSEAEVCERYKDLGYTDADAALIAHWVEMDVGDRDKDLTRSQLEQLFKGDIIDLETLKSELSELGYNERDAIRIGDYNNRLKLKAAQAEQERRDKAERTDKLLTPSDAVKAYKQGIIDRAAAFHKLNRYGYDGNDCEIILSMAEKDMAPDKPTVSVKTLSASDVKNAYKYGVIDKGSALRELINLGYSPPNANILLLTVEYSSPVEET